MKKQTTNKMKKQTIDNDNINNRRFEKEFEREHLYIRKNIDGDTYGRVRATVQKFPKLHQECIMECN